MCKLRIKSNYPNRQNNKQNTIPIHRLISRKVSRGLYRIFTLSKHELN